MLRRLTRVLLAGLLGASMAVGLAACTARDIPYHQLESRYASADSRFVVLPNGVRVHYRDQGPKDAPPIVLVHGFAASLHTWEPWVARLTPQYRVISLDLPGHGLTRAPDGYVTSVDANVDVVDRIASTVGLTRFALAGNSMGGAVAWNYALKHGDRLTALILVDAAGYPSPNTRREGSPLVFKLLANPVGRAVLRNVDPALMAEKGLKQAYVDERLVTPAVVTRYVELARAPGHRAILTGQRPGGPPITPETFKAIRTPTLVMSGEADTLIPVENARGLAGAIPGAKLVTYPGVGHVPMEQIPDRSVADVKAFPGGLPPQS